MHKPKEVTSAKGTPSNGGQVGTYTTLKFVVANPAALGKRRIETTTIGNPTPGSDSAPLFPIQGEKTGFMQVSKPVSAKAKVKPVAPTPAAPVTVAATPIQKAP